MVNGIRRLIALIGLVPFVSVSSYRIRAIAWRLAAQFEKYFFNRLLYSNCFVCMLDVSVALHNRSVKYSRKSLDRNNGLESIASSRLMILLTIFFESNIFYKIFNLFKHEFQLIIRNKNKLHVIALLFLKIRN